MATVEVVIGSINDLESISGVFSVLDEFGVEYAKRVMSAHRTPALVADFARDAEKKGVKVIIAAAGKAAHLAGVIAGETVLPVIGIPVKSSTMDGLDSLLSTVQMPSGVPVATVAINGAQNAGLLAVQMLALSDKSLCDKLYAYKAKMYDKIVADDKKLNGTV